MGGLRGNRAHRTSQRDGGEDDGMLAPLVALPYLTPLPTSSITSKRYARPLHRVSTEILTQWI